MKIIAGVDEVGRGRLIGPVYAAAVILNISIKKNRIKKHKNRNFLKIGFWVRSKNAFSSFT